MTDNKKLYDYSKLKGKIKEIFDTQEKYAEAINITATSLTNKLNSKTYFNQIQIDNSIEVLGIQKNEVDIYFFTQQVEKTQ